MPEALLVSENFAYDNLFAGDYPRVARKITLLSGENRTKGALLGKISKAVAAAVADGGNTGNGTVGSLTMGAKAKIGTYTLTCIATATNGGTFSVIDPDGVRLKDAVVGVAYTSSGLNLTIADGGTDFAAGDKFTIAVSAGSGKYKLAASASVDGSQELPECLVLAKDTDASSADVETLAYQTGEFNQNKMTFGTGYTAAGVKEELAKKGMFLKESVTA